MDLHGAWEWVGRLDEAELVATWLDYPGITESAGLAVILIFYPGSYWSKTAFYNRNALPKRVDPQPEDDSLARRAP